MQWHGPSADWAYATEQAMIIQQERDRDAETLQQILARKKAEVETIEKKIAELKKGKS
jgi:hypothetical protein